MFYWGTYIRNGMQCFFIISFHSGSSFYGWHIFISQLSIQLLSLSHFHQNANTMQYDDFENFYFDINPWFHFMRWICTWISIVWDFKRKKIGARLLRLLLLCSRKSNQLVFSYRIKFALNEYLCMTLFFDGGEMVFAFVFALVFEFVFVFVFVFEYFINFGEMVAAQMHH